jgi:hypothetical protein
MDIPKRRDSDQAIDFFEVKFSRHDGSRQSGRIHGDRHRGQKDGGRQRRYAHLAGSGHSPDKDTWIDGDFGFQLDRAN